MSLNPFTFKYPLTPKKMTISERQRSTEQCAEAGWYAFSYATSLPITADFILSLKPLGSFIYMKAMRKPFFKVENDTYIIKGMEGDNHFIIATHRDNIPRLTDIEQVVTDIAAIH